ncbi:glutamate--tRNA ligase [Flavobacterium sp. xlx-214]|uniref:glutamate--tRNA ligase n=1 Tax=unclassified Flavobacterium TaxID=196869 RepID=UPI0013D0A219|nr:MULTISPECIES: glutamate--tRNA ligase [unclassified Flavobacterium]MBA5792088.1 glutamate--tRNA ligase [Flavobacterium sp. xlx-221]QMI84335.1 glutamate--tRNA ligase [Flavobacterium sp. xlx-214]
MTQQVRVRFAPSPTGPLHIGGVRTALFNYLFAKKNNGIFYIRIEDTDQNRFVPGAEEYIFEALKWLGIEPDETIGKNEKMGPYRQSDRKHLYKQYALDLVHNGFAYYAFDTAEDLDALRKETEAAGNTFIYNHSVRNELKTSLNMTHEELQARLFNEDPYVIRFKMPVDEKLVLQDIIRGEVTFDTSLLDDKVLFKSDGMPTYHLANIVDDHLQETSHVIRGEEWLPSLPLHYLLYRSFGWKAPEFAHLPLILKPIGNGKLSKRDGDKLGFPVFPLDWKSETGETSTGYREKGYFPEAVVNFLALLGWNDGTDKEIYTLEELIQSFDLDRVSKSGAKFDPEKNKWFNHQVIVHKTNTELAPYLQAALKQNGIEANNDVVEKVIGLIKERANLTTDLYSLADFFFIAPKAYDEKAAKNWKEDTNNLMTQVIEVVSAIDSFEAKNIETIVKNWILEKELGMGKIMQPLRIALVGEMKGPDLFEIIAVLGKNETVNRLQAAINHFQ